ncbi:hypothetical protein AAC387_Pa07g0380 [Persea americana]
MANNIAARVLGGIRPLLEGLIGRQGDGHRIDHEDGHGIEEDGHGTEEDGHDIDEERDAWVNSIQMKLNANTLPQNADIETSCIPRVPEGFCRDTNEVYEPCIISIGPYHGGKLKFEHMEMRKWQCLRDILERRRGIHLNDFFKVLRPLEVQARSLYSDDIHLESMDFMEMMLLDGCFIVDYLRQPSQYIPDTRTWIEHQINNDLLLLENQVPFFVLNHIYPLIKEERETEVLLDLALKFCSLVCAKRTTLSVAMLSGRNFQHLLHFYHAYLFYDERGRSDQPIESEMVRTIHTARFLKKAGIKFKKKKVIDKVIDIRFTEGVLNITPLVIDAFTISQYRNLIAFEKFDPSIEPRFTAFAQFMDYLINKSKDVILLREKGIIEHALGSDEEVANVFNQLTTGTFEYLTLELATVYREVDKYCKKKKNQWMAKLMRDHLSSPWAITSIGFGVLILIFGVIQVVMSLLNYIKHKSFGH